MMSVSNTVRMAITGKGMSQATLAREWGLTTQAMNNKFYRDSWSAEDLIKVAEITGGKLALVYPDGQQLLFLAEDPEGKAGK